MNAFGDFESLYEENNKLNNLLFLITQKFKNQNDDYLSREKYLKIFLIKIASTNQTLINSYKSIKINVNNKNAEIIDYPSIFLLSRAILAVSYTHLDVYKRQFQLHIFADDFFHPNRGKNFIDGLFGNHSSKIRILREDGTSFHLVWN